MSITAGIILLYCVATIVAIASRRWRVPYTAALLIAGLALGATHIARTAPHEGTALRDLPAGLLFEAAYHLEVHELRENAWAISALAVPGVRGTFRSPQCLLVAGSAHRR